MDDVLQFLRQANAAMAVIGVIGVIAAHAIYTRQVEKPDRVRIQLLNAIAVGCAVFGIQSVYALLTAKPLTWLTFLSFGALAVFIWAAVKAARDRTHLTAQRRSTDR